VISKEPALFGLALFCKKEDHPKRVIFLKRFCKRLALGEPSTKCNMIKKGLFILKTMRKHNINGSKIEYQAMKSKIITCRVATVLRQTRKRVTA